MKLAGGILIFGVLALSACSPNNKGSKTQSNGAIVQLNQNEGDLKTLQEKFPNNEIQVISLEDNLFQIQGARVDEVKALLPLSQIEDDEIVNYLNPEHDDIVLGKFDNLEKYTDVRGKYLSLGCHRNAPLPVAQIEVKSRTKFLVSTVVEQNSPNIVLTAESSRTANSQPQAGWNPSENFNEDPLSPDFWGTTLEDSLTYHWLIDTPPASETVSSVDGVEAEIIPDRHGGYTAILIVQDRTSKACSFAIGTIGVTRNEAYRGKTNTPRVAVDTDLFHHLSIVEAQKAWRKSRGDNVVVAVIDTGVNYNHPELADNIFINEGEIPGNGIDDDKNGLVDDVYGYDFALGDNIPFDDESHGTHVTGLVAGKNIGVAPNAKILPVKALLATGQATNSAVLSAIHYAIRMKVDIINMSLGGKGPTSPLALQALKKAQEAGILVVVAAGNSSENLDIVPSHFTNKDGTNVLAIASSDENGALTNYSCYGQTTVDMAAPGGSDLLPATSASTWHGVGPGLSFIGYSGTSMAAPVAAGVAALAKALNPTITAEALKAKILETGVHSDHLIGKVHTPRVVNAKNIVDQLSFVVD